MEFSDRTWERIKTAGIFMLGLAALLSAVGLIMVSSLAVRIEESAECRYDENADISTINDRIDLQTAIGLKALVEEDDEALNKALAEIESLTTQFDNLIPERDDIVEECSL